ncbi:hypothetical protein ABW20_dc0100316 [Dactylellina cionopaga]|nr:hypothetical protein ABW20_dc0100316 [Dactylellina cionopaga]
MGQYISSIFVSDFYWPGPPLQDFLVLFDTYGCDPERESGPGLRFYFNADDPESLVRELEKFGMAGSMLSVAPNISGPPINRNQISLTLGCI